MSLRGGSVATLEGKADHSWLVAQTPTQRRRWAWLSHPLVLLLIGGAFTAGITNYLVPSITRQWQNHDKELELKSGLVTTVNRAAFDFFESIRLIEYGAKPKTLAPLDQAYVRWLTSTAVISAEMNTYFPSRKLNSDLNEVYLTTQVVYELFKTSNWTGRGEVISEIRGSSTTSPSTTSSPNHCSRSTSIRSGTATTPMSANSSR